MPKNAKHEFPTTLFVHVCDHIGEVPVFAAETHISEIPEDQHGELVAVYLLSYVRVLHVAKQLA